MRMICLLSEGAWIFLGPQVEVAGAMLPTEEVPDQSTE